MIGRWLAHLSEFGLSNAHMEYRSGAKHLNADALSRIPIRLCERTDCTDCGAHNAVQAAVGGIDGNSNEGVTFWSLTELIEAQEDDHGIWRVAQWFLTGANWQLRPTYWKVHHVTTGLH